MSAYAWKRRRLDRVRVREDLKVLNSPRGGVVGLMDDLWATRRDRWGFRWRKSVRPADYRPHLIT